MLEMAILGLLKEQPMHGYDLRKRLRAATGLLSSVSFGSLYPTLARLEREGAVRELVASGTSHSTDAIGVTGSLSGERAMFRARLAARAGASGGRQKSGGSGARIRKVYELTPRGEELFDRLLTAEEADGADGKSFALRWAFARHLSPEARLRLLERRRRQLEDRLPSARRVADAPVRHLDPFERSLVEHSRALVRFELDWVDGLIAAERSSSQAGAAGLPAAGVS
jgi:DNA-binding PadR family transcriptional regulator